MNRFDVRRLDHTVDLDGEIEHWDLVVPVIDDLPLSDRLLDRALGTFAVLVGPPSRHWLGEPQEDPYGPNDGRAEVLTGTCGESGCCGVFARITIEGDQVTWDEFDARGVPPLPTGLRFVFDRIGYEEALDQLAGSQ
ncbi:MAG: hypothetical protein ACT452_01100 [Microthrixaceae bacterium]